jgi:hypothetical protein
LTTNIVPEQIRPFGLAAPSGLGGDRRAFDVAAAYYQQRDRIAEDAGILNALIAAIHAEYDLTPTQWAQWYSVALGFHPDLIVELGRGRGNSTAVFCQAASRLGRTRVVSLCNSKEWARDSLPKVKAVVGQPWLERLDARSVNILDVDYGQLFEGAERVLLLWDAHGFEIAEIVLGRILPLIAERPHLVLMHDISDNRYGAASPSYEGQPLWKGSTWDKGTGRSTGRVNIGWMSSLQDQVIAIGDFSTRNGFEVGSGDHEYARFFGAHPGYADEMRRAIGDRFFSPAAHWVFFSLAGVPPPIHFPAVQRRFRHYSEVTIHDTRARRWFGRGLSLPRVIETRPVPWEYSAVMGVRPRREIPADAQRSLRVCLRVEDAPAGIGLLNADQSAFIQSKCVLPGIDAATVWLAIDDPAAAGPLVVHTWETPESARVQIDGISMVW